MRHGTGRLLVAGLIGTGSVAWGLAGGLSGIAHAAAGGQQCEPLTAASSSASAVNLCVSVQASQASVKRGQAASFTVEVFTQNGPATGVSVTLAAGPSGQTATFSGSCPGGNGAATCAVGALATSVAPASYSMQAQIAVPASASSSVTAVTLTATADAAVSPAMATEPATSGTVAVSGTASASPSPSPSPSKTAASTTPTSTAPTTSPVAAVSPVSTVALPTVPPVTLAPVPSTVLTPQDVASDLPTITPVAVVPTPATGTTSSPVADTGSPQAGSFTLSLNMSAATAEVLGLIVVALALTMAGTKLVADVFNARRTSGPRPTRTKPAHGKPGGDGKAVSGGGSAGARTMFFRRPRRPPVPPAPPPIGPGSSPPAPTQQIPGTLPENTI